MTRHEFRTNLLFLGVPLKAVDSVLSLWGRALDVAAEKRAMAIVSERDEAARRAELASPKKLSVRDAAALVGCCEKTIKLAIRRRELPAWKPNPRMILLERSDIRAWAINHLNVSQRVPTFDVPQLPEAQAAQKL